MSALLTIEFRHSIAAQIPQYGSLDNYYLTFGKTTSFTNDSSPPDPSDSVQSSHIDIFNDMIFGKRISGTDVAMAVRRYDWVAGTVYTPYDHEDPTLFNKNTAFFVVVNEGLSYSVFKCLGNSGGVPSLNKPSLYETSADDDFYFTADGYQWKYMYTISKADFEKFATPNYIPVVANTDVTANAVSGAIEAIQVTNRGTRYNAYHGGVIQVARVGGNNQLYTIEASAAANTDFYKNSVIKITTGPGAGQQRVISDYIVSGGVKRVLVAQPFDPSNMPTEDSTYEISPNIILTGDGQNFVGRALVNAISNTIYAVEITNKGSGYSWANAVVVSNTGIINTSSNTFIQANNAQLRVVISPPGGHGSDAETELGSTYVCISSTINTVEAGGKIVANNDFRTISLIKNPLFANVVINTANSVGTFSVGEKVIQPRDSITGTSYNVGIVSEVNSNQLTLSNVSGVFGVSNTQYSLIAPPDGTEYVYGTIYNESNSATASITSTSADNPELYFDQTTTFVCNVTSSAVFLADEEIYQPSTDGVGRVYYANNTMIKVSNKFGTFNQAETGTNAGMVYGRTSLASANVTAIKLPDVIRNSGEVLYIENVSPIARANGQSETIKIVLEF